VTVRRSALYRLEDARAAVSAGGISSPIGCFAGLFSMFWGAPPSETSNAWRQRALLLRRFAGAADTSPVVDLAAPAHGLGGQHRAIEALELRSSIGRPSVLSTMP
jgi:hypothetical protein